MSDRAHDLTDKEIERIQRSVAAFYKKADKTVFDIMMAAYSEIQKEADALKEEVDNAGTKEEKDEAIKRYRSLFVGFVSTRKFKNAVNSASRVLYRANQRAADYINSKAPAVYTLNYNETGKGLQGDLTGYKFQRVSQEEVEEYGELLTQAVDEKKDRRWNRQNITKAVVAGAILIRAGQKIMREASDKTVTKNRESADRQASDMMTSAENKGRFDSMCRANDEGFEVQKRWVCTFDNKTRDSHIEYDSMGVVDLDYEYNTGLRKPRDPDCSIMEEVCNCRCALTYETGKGRGSTRSAREGDVTGSYKRSASFEGTETVYVPSTMSYEEWMKWR